MFIDRLESKAAAGQQQHSADTLYKLNDSYLMYCKPMGGWSSSTVLNTGMRLFSTSCEMSISSRPGRPETSQPQWLGEDKSKEKGETSVAWQC